LFASGAIIYAYIGGNPVNSIDPLGLDATSNGMWMVPEQYRYLPFNPSGFGEGAYRRCEAG
jgi:hypothetical protein